MSQRSAVNIMIFETNEEDEGVAFNQILPTFVMKLPIQESRLNLEPFTEQSGPGFFDYFANYLVISGAPFTNRIKLYYQHG